MIYRDGVVVNNVRTWEGAGIFEVEVDSAPTNATLIGKGQRLHALAYDRIVGPVKVGDRLRLECSALAKRLGTGGQASVVTNLSALPSDYLPNGHMVKARYMPTQVMVSAADEQGSPTHDKLTRIENVPVVAADLHSQLPAIISGARAAKADARIAYVMTDGAALPLPLSMQVAELVRANWLCGTVTAGQAWGGTYEAVSIPSALQVAAAALSADLIVVSQGPGNLGGDTEFGFSGVDVAWTLTAAAVLGARPIAALRISGADKRNRHLGLSHHTHTVLADLTQVGVDLPLPSFATLDNMPEGFDALVAKQVAQACAGRHHIREVDASGAYELLQDSPVRLRTMGRSLEEDAAIFVSGWAAGNYALS